MVVAAIVVRQQPKSREECNAMSGPTFFKTFDPHESQRLRVGVIGGGHLGRIHAKLLNGRDDIEFVGVADPQESSRQQASQSLGVKGFEDHAAMLEQIDAAIIATPTTLHGEIGSQCLERGVHVLMEKPIAATVDEAVQLCRLADSNDCCLQVGHVERFNPVWMAAQSQLQDSKPRYIEARREGVYTGRSTDIGIVLDLMIHDLDLVLSIVKSPIERVAAFGRCVLGTHEDHAIAHVSFRNGCMAQFRASRISEQTSRCMEIQCDERWLSIDFAKSEFVSTEPTANVVTGELRADVLSFADRAKVKDELFQRWLVRETVTPETHNAIALEHTDFLDSIRERRSPVVSGRSALSALQLACEITEQIAARESVHGGIIPASRFAAARKRAG